MSTQFNAGVAAQLGEDGPARKVVDQVVGAVIQHLKSDLLASGRVALSGLGVFSVKERPGRTGRNPRTGAAVQIESSKTARFRPSKALKDELNGRQPAKRGKPKAKAKAKAK